MLPLPCRGLTSDFQKRPLRTEKLTILITFRRLPRQGIIYVNSFAGRLSTISITALFVPADPALAAALADSAAAGLPEIAVSPAQGLLLTVLARAWGAQHPGDRHHEGYSAICLARAPLAKWC